MEYSKPQQVLGLREFPQKGLDAYKANTELREKRKQKLPSVTTFSPRNSLSELGSPLGLPKEFAQMEQKLQETQSEEDWMFYYHSSEDRIVLSYALFWTMTQLQYFKGKIRKEKLPTVTAFSSRDSLSKLSSPLGLLKEFFLLLRQYEEEMLDAFLQDDDYFSELLHYCNIMYEMLPTILMSSHMRAEKDARKLAAISVVAAGYGGDTDEELCNELLDDIDYHFNKVKCRKIEQMMPQLMKMVEGETGSM